MPSEVFTAGIDKLLKPVWPQESTAVGYKWCDSVEPTIALFESFSVAVEREYTAHGMWVMAELVAKATASFISDSNVTSNSSKVRFLLISLGPDQYR